MKNKATGVIICGHGSRSSQGRELFAAMARRFAADHPELEVIHAFLELQQPDFRTAVASLTERGITNIVVIPAFLFTGIHVAHDIPLEFREIAASYADVKIRMASYIGVHEHLRELIHIRLHELMSRVNADPWEKYALMMVGVGASIDQANSDFAMIVRQVGDDLHAVRSEFSFISEMAQPGFEEALEQMAKKVSGTILVLPVLLFPGIYLKRITAISRKIAMNNQSKIEIAEVLGTHTEFTKVLYERCCDVLQGKTDLIASLSDSLIKRREFFNS